MAYTLKTTGLATVATMVLAVDQDGTTVKEFKNSTVNSQMTVHANVTKGSSTWKGTSRGYFQTYPNGATNFYGVTFGATRAAWDMTDSDGAGWFMALADFDSKSSGDARLMVNPTNANAVGFDTSLHPKLFHSGTNYTSSATVTASTKFSMAGNAKVSATWAIYYGAESGSLALAGSGVEVGFVGNASINYLGGYAGDSYVAGKYHLVAVFSRELTLAEYQSLHDDWFGTLFDAGAAPPPPPVQRYVVNC